MPRTGIGRMCTSTFGDRLRHRLCTTLLNWLTDCLIDWPTDWVTVRFRMHLENLWLHIMSQFFAPFASLEGSRRIHIHHIRHSIQSTSRHVLILPSHLCLGLRVSLFHPDLPLKILYESKISLARAAYSTLIAIDKVTTLSPLDEEYRPWISSLSLIVTLLLLHSWDQNFPWH